MPSSARITRSRRRARDDALGPVENNTNPVLAKCARTKGEGRGAPLQPLHEEDVSEDKRCLVNGAAHGAPAPARCPFSSAVARALRFPSDEQPTTDEVPVSKCPFRHGTAEYDPYPGGYIHGKEPAICKHGCQPTSLKHEAPMERLRREALEYQELFHAEFNSTSEEKAKRVDAIMSEIDHTGAYTHTFQEMQHGVRVAWRNAPKCVNRFQWNVIDVLDRRDVDTNQGMADAIVSHLKEATNGGVIQARCSLFKPVVPGVNDCKGARIWNGQLCRYAGYRMPDGSVLGDPAEIKFTDMLRRRFPQWSGFQKSPGRFDILPLILQADPSKPPEMFELPTEAVLEVPIRHPVYGWFADLGLKWYAVPAVSNMHFDIGGLRYTAAPFNGWYMVTEVATRNFGDVGRYDMLPTVAQRMGLNTEVNTSLWRDQALAVLAVAVMHSFAADGVSMVDHHSTTAKFYAWYNEEMKTRGYCPGNWKWIIPPAAPSSSECYLGLNKMTEYTLKPCLLPGPAWNKFEATCEIYREGDKARRNTGSTFFSVIFCLRLIIKLRTIRKAMHQNICIVYATESGRTKGYAEQAASLLGRVCNVELLNASVFDPSSASHKSLLASSKLVILMTSTFGSGDPPQSASGFVHWLKEQASPYMQGKVYTVFGLGNSCYTKFCGAAVLMDRLAEQAGGKRLLEVYKADEMGGEALTFRGWIKSLVQRMHTDAGLFSAQQALRIAGNLSDNEFQPMFHLELLHPSEAMQRRGARSLSNAKHHACVEEVRELLAPAVSADKLAPHSITTNQLHSTKLVRLNIAQVMKQHYVTYSPGDHILVYPQNPLRTCVLPLMAHLAVESIDQYFNLELLEGVESGRGHYLQQHLPCTFREVFCDHVDLTSPPTPKALAAFLPYADSLDGAALRSLVNSQSRYDEWVKATMIRLCDVFEWFPSLSALNGPTAYSAQSPSSSLSMIPSSPGVARVPSSPGAHLFEMSQPDPWLTGGLPVEIFLQVSTPLRPRYYSVASSNKHTPQEAHICMSRVMYKISSGATRQGLCSTYMALLQPGSLVRFHVQPAAAFHLPESMLTPMLLIGAGTGIAPFRGFWQERMACLGSGGMVGPCVLVFGFRHKSTQGELFDAEIQQAVEAGAISHYLPAVSRPAPPQKGVYVQDNIRGNTNLVRELLVDAPGHVYVCGDVIMGDSVLGEVEKAVGSRMWEEMEDTSRVHRDLFGVTLHAEKRNAEASSAALTLTRRQSVAMKVDTLV